MAKIRHKKKATEISPDGIAAAAATLAAKSEYLQKGQDLYDAFWVFFDDLLDNQMLAERDLDEENKSGEKEGEAPAGGKLAKQAIKRGM